MFPKTQCVLFYKKGLLEIFNLKYLSNILFFIEVKKNLIKYLFIDDSKKKLNNHLSLLYLEYMSIFLCKIL